MTIERRPPAAAMTTTGVHRALRETREQMARVFDALHEGVVVQDRDGRIVAHNPAAERILGLRGDEIDGRTSRDPRWHVIREDGTPFPVEEHPALVSLKSGLPVHNEVMGISRSDGSLVWVNVNTAPYADDTGELQGVFVGFTEITERKRQEEQLKSALASLNSTLESTADGILVVGLDGRIIQFNHRFVEMWRIPQAILDTRSDEKALAFVLDQLADPAAFEASVDELMKDVLAESFDLLKFKDGRIYERYSRPQIVDGEPSGRVWSFRDATARVGSERLQVALFKISNASHESQDLEHLYVRIHGIIGELLPARNFYIALLDDTRDEVTFAYWVDEVDQKPEPRRFSDGGSLTNWVLRSGKPLLLTPQSGRDGSMPAGVQLVGTDSIDWLGIPLKAAGKTIGMLAVQSYSGEVRYDEKHLELLQFVSDQVAAAVGRKQAEARLRDNEDKFRRVFDQSPSIICLLSYPEGQFLEVNAAGVQAFGHGREDIVGHTSTELKVWVNPQDRVRFLSALQAVGSVQDFETVLRRKNGEHFTVLFNGSLITLGGRQYSLNSIQDITERKHAEHWQQHYSLVLAMITAETPLPTVLEALACFIERQSPGALCSILLLSTDGKHLNHGAAPSLPDFYIKSIDGAEIGPTAGTCGAAAALGRAVTTGDIHTSPNWASWRELAARANLGACWSVPILSAEKKVVGTFALYHAGRWSPTPDDEELLRRSTSLAALAIDRARHQEAQRLAKTVFEENVEGVMVTAPDDRILTVNRAFENLTGYRADEAIGNTPAKLLDSGRHGETFWSQIHEQLAQGGRWEGEVWSRRKNGEVYPIQMSIADVRDDAGIMTQRISIMSDMSLQKVQAARIEQLAFYDSLTGLPNRALFLDRLEHILAAAERRGDRGAILFMDLDRFKEINDSKGHAIGDLALTETARRFLTATRKEETLARLGGDEFVLIAEGADHRSAALIASRLLQSLAEPLVLMGVAHTIGTSIGIAFYPDDGRTSEELIKHTDIAMYRAKAEGGGYRFYQAEMSTELEKRLGIAQRLGPAMEANQLQLYYQPKISLGTKKLVGAEALLRWHDPEMGWISPSVFIPVAEQRGMMSRLGDWVLREACRQLGEWRIRGLELPGRLSINVSAQQIEDPEVLGRMLEIVHAAGGVPQWLELELTESSMMSNPERAVEIMNFLATAGFGLSIDDFGTGYSSLSYLKRFSADEIKIDISFVRNMLNDANDYAIVNTIIAMAHGFGMTTTAEGVESEGQAEALRGMGCDIAQGFLYSRPEAPDAFAEKWLSSNRMAKKKLPSDPGNPVAFP